MAQDNKYRAFSFAKEIARVKLSDFSAALRNVPQNRGVALHRLESRSQQPETISNQKHDQQDDS